MPPKKVLVALPPGLLEQTDFVAQVEHRNRSDLIREALRRYIEQFKRAQNQQMVVRTGNRVSLGELVTLSVPGPQAGNYSGEPQSLITDEDGESLEAEEVSSDREALVL